MAYFLSSEWFDKVSLLNEQAGELNLPPKIHNLVLNLWIDDTPLHIKEGKLAKGELSSAKSTVKISLPLAKTLAQDKDLTAALEAFLVGQIKVEGDFSTLFTLKGAKPTSEQKQLYKNILAATDFEG